MIKLADDTIRERDREDGRVESARSNTPLDIRSPILRSCGLRWEKRKKGGLSEERDGGKARKLRSEAFAVGENPLLFTYRRGGLIHELGLALASQRSCTSCCEVSLNGNSLLLVAKFSFAPNPCNKSDLFFAPRRAEERQRVTPDSSTPPKYILCNSNFELCFAPNPPTRACVRLIAKILPSLCANTRLPRPPPAALSIRAIECPLAKRVRQFRHCSKNQKFEWGQLAVLRSCTFITSDGLCKNREKNRRSRA